MHSEKFSFYSGYRIVDICEHAECVAVRGERANLLVTKTATVPTGERSIIVLQLLPPIIEQIGAAEKMVDIPSFSLGGQCNR